ncbi:MAG TPA: hypothetical protein VFC78_23880 [Tepidisphaeraceae bacterium]|nr:hypothetical protein [Tepidisphaeraceae bacterium]
MSDQSPSFFDAAMSCDLEKVKVLLQVLGSAIHKFPKFAEARMWRGLCPRVGTVAVLMAAVSCSSFRQAYSGPRLAPEQVATITVDPGSDRMVNAGGVNYFVHLDTFITQLDGANVELASPGSGPIEILPGQYSLQLGFEVSAGIGQGTRYHGTQPVTFTASAGRYYRVHTYGPVSGDSHGLNGVQFSVGEAK